MPLSRDLRRKIRILHVVGARPNFMKIAPVLTALDQRPDQFDQLLVHTGQHYDDAMSDVFFRELQVRKPDVNLAVGSGTHAWQTAQVMMRFESVLAEYSPDWVLVPGDVNSTLACALVAAKLGRRVAHVEAGLRSFDRTMPEEINRLVADHLSDLLLTPSLDADENLRREGVDPRKIHFVGNVMIDTLVRLKPRAEPCAEAVRARMKVSRPYILVTLHRPSNVDCRDDLSEIMAALHQLADSLPVVFPVHPRTRQQIEQMGLKPCPRVLLTPPLGYLDFLALELGAALVLTDSGGVQEETTYLGVPCLTIRPNTERPITIHMGTNELVSGAAADIVAASHRRLNPANFVSPRIPPLWDGRTAERIADLLEGMA
jgi:UDP-N-acetylglucosamine 2-epimerase (non-hydrolysing)